MHLKPVYEPKDRRHVHDLIEDVVLGALVAAGPAGLTARMPRIVCFEMPIERIEARFQLGQEERAADITAAAAVLDERGDTDVAALVREYNADRA